jgi:hypothetical protein
VELTCRSNVQFARALCDRTHTLLIDHMPGRGKRVRPVSRGADGAKGAGDPDAAIFSVASASVIATWFEDTPSSGLDMQTNAAATGFA